MKTYVVVVKVEIWGWWWWRVEEDGGRVTKCE